MKKFIASLLSISMLTGSFNNVTFADNNTVKKETVITLKEELTKDELQPKSELTKEERQAAKLAEQFNEKLNNSYGDIISKNPCMKEAFTEVQTFLEPSFTFTTRPAIEDKLNKLESEEESLINYKKTLLESNNSNEEDTKKQLKNIDNRLQAINYTKNCLKTYIRKKDKEQLPIVISLVGVLVAMLGYCGFLFYKGECL